MMFLRSSSHTEQRIDACFAGQPANTLPVRACVCDTRPDSEGIFKPGVANGTGFFR